MNNTYIVNIETENPVNKWTQAEVLDSMKNNPNISKLGQKLYSRFLEDPGIKERYFALNTLQDVNFESPDESLLRFERVGADIASKALKKSLDKAELAAKELDGLIVTTCTGYLCPGLSSYISEKLGLRDDLFSIDYTGTGCGAALPAMRSAKQFLDSNPNSNIAVVSVEICSAALSWGDEIDLILSNSIFADGAAACLLSNKETYRDKTSFMDFVSVLWPKHRDDLRFKLKNARLCNVIAKNVPDVAASAVKTLNDELKNKTATEFDYYGVHPGGRKVLDEVETALGMEIGSLKESRDVLAHYGNMSSPSILFVLKNILEKTQPKPGEKTALFAFGAGFSAFGLGLQHR